jgi:hypothetical protein
MSSTLVKLVGVIALITFIIGMIYAFGGFCFGVWLTNVSDDAYIENQNVPGWNLLFSIGAMFGGGFFGALSIVFGVIVAIYDVLAHIPALIAYFIGKKNGNRTIYWILIVLWICLLFGAPIVLTVV